MATTNEGPGARPRMEEYDRQRAKRADRLFHWSLDMPPGEDDVDVRVNKGMSWRELAVIIGGLLGAGYLFTQDQRTPNETPPSSPAVQRPVDSEYDVRFYDKDGDLIDVKPLSSSMPRQ